MKKTADLSPCGLYRYELTRTWDESVRPVCFVMLNPSKADAEINDPTIVRCINFAKAWGNGGIVVVNLFAWRATDPKDMKKVKYRAVGNPRNHDAILSAANRCHPVVCAWGAHGDWLFRDRQVKIILKDQGEPYPVCLGLTKKGMPRHPLFVTGNAALVPFITG